VTRCLFATDLHGSAERYRKLLATIRDERPDALFLGGDLLPSGMLVAGTGSQGDFVPSFLVPELSTLRADLGTAYPRIFLILGNDDARAAEVEILAGQELGLYEYVHNRRVAVDRFAVYGYACVPPTPFLLKDWERYDVSRYVEPGCVSPEEGVRTAPTTASEVRFGTIAKDLAAMVGDADLAGAVLLCHAPPHDTALDRAALDGTMVDHVQVDVHVGSIALRRLIEASQPLLSLHGHIHESARLTGAWRDRIGATILFSAAHDGRELCLVRFSLEDLEAAQRELV
jgi:uncharacterized protein